MQAFDTNAPTGNEYSFADGVADGLKVLGWDGSAHDTTGFSSAFIEVTSYNLPITINGGIAATNPIQAINLATNATSATITAPGLYAVPAVGNLTLTGNSGSVVNLMLKR
jgi:hypothetical protein